MLARFALISGTVFLSCCLAAPEPFFSIRSKGTTGRVEVRYFLTGAFGGYGGFVRDAQKDGVYRIPLFVDRRTEQAGRSGTPAESLKAILYSTGCQFDLLSVDLNVTSNRTVNFGCRALPTIRLSGRILPPPKDAGPLDIEIHYLAAWDHGFFGFFDGAVARFKVATAPLDAAGQFQVEIPDFSKDAVTTQKIDAYLDVLVVSRSSGNIVQMVAPAGEWRHQNLGLKILSRYDPELPFKAR